MSARWVLVRHGQSTANAEGWLSGWRDVPLTALGRAQAQSVRLPSVDRVLCSDLQRARHTAGLACEAYATPTPRLRERHLGAWEGERRAMLKGRPDLNERLLSWDVGPPRGEAHLDLARRVVGYLAELDDTVDTAIFAHGAVNRTLVGLIDEVEPARVGFGNVRNGEVIERQVPAGTWRRWARRLGVVPALEEGLPASLAPSIERLAREGGQDEQGSWRLEADDRELRIGEHRWPLAQAYDLAARLTRV